MLTETKTIPCSQCYITYNLAAGTPTADPFICDQCIADPSRGNMFHPQVSAPPVNLTSAPVDPRNLGTQPVEGTKDDLEAPEEPEPQPEFHDAEILNAEKAAQSQADAQPQ